MYCEACLLLPLNGNRVRKTFIKLYLKDFCGYVAKATGAARVAAFVVLCRSFVDVAGLR